MKGIIKQNTKTSIFSIFTRIIILSLTILLFSISHSYAVLSIGTVKEMQKALKEDSIGQANDYQIQLIYDNQIIRTTVPLYSIPCYYMINFLSPHILNDNISVLSKEIKWQYHDGYHWHSFTAEQLQQPFAMLNLSDNRIKAIVKVDIQFGSGQNKSSKANRKTIMKSYHLFLPSNS